VRALGRLGNLPVAVDDLKRDFGLINVAIADKYEMLDQVLLLDDRHLDCLMRQYKLYFNESRPRQGR
jgi:hypothetical protein